MVDPLGGWRDCEAPLPVAPKFSGQVSAMDPLSLDFENPYSRVARQRRGLSVKFTSSITLACMVSLTFSGAALAADKATGWKNWADHAERISAAADSGDLAAVGAACKGSTTTIISQGFQFPYWAQMLPQFCNVYKTESRKRIVTMKGWRAECKALNSRMNSLSKAEAVAEEPRAAPLALHMAETLQTLSTRECSHKPERESR